MKAERLQKIIANAGVTSRRKAEELILAGRVKLNGQTVTELGSTATADDAIEVNGTPINHSVNFVYYLLNKPRGVISSTNDELHRKTILDIVETDQRIYPVGRLDYDTTGLILLTNDGELTQKLTHPKNEVQKTYLAKINSHLTIEQVRRLEEGISYEKVNYSPAKIKTLKYSNDSSMVQVVIHEGKNHEIKNLFAALDIKVIKLTRTKFSNLDIGNLRSGEYRSLTKREVDKLKNDK